MTAAYYRKKPVVIRAEQYKGPASLPMDGVDHTIDGAPYVITVHEQVAFIVPGDWIIPEPPPEPPATQRYYPCKADIFAATYESVDGHELTHVVYQHVIEEDGEVVIEAEVAT